MELRVARQKVGQILITEKLYTHYYSRGEIFGAATATIAAGNTTWKICLLY